MSQNKLATCENCKSHGISVQPVVNDGEIIAIVVDCNDCMHIQSFYTKTNTNMQIQCDGLAIWLESPELGNWWLDWDETTQTWYFMEKRS